MSYGERGWTAAIDLGFSAKGRRRRAKVTARTKTLAKAKLTDKTRERDDALELEISGYTVSDAVNSWLDHALVGRQPNTVANRTCLAETRMLPALGSRRVTDLRAEDHCSVEASSVPG